MFQKIEQALLTAIPRPMHFLPWGAVILSRAVSQRRIWRHLSRTVGCFRAPRTRLQRTVEQVTASVRQGHIPNAQWSSLSSPTSQASLSGYES